MRLMEENKHLDPLLSQAFKQLSDILSLNYKDGSSFAGENSLFGGENQKNISQS